MNDNDLQRALEIAKTAVVEVGPQLRQHFGNIESETKNAGDEANLGVGSIVTRLDKETEKFLAQELGRFDNSIGFRGEEFGTSTKADTTWLVDPIDGTSHFVRGLPFCTTMVALIEDGQVVLSVIYDFIREDTYWAIRGKGAYRNEEKLQVSDRPLDQGLISFETKINRPKNNKVYLQLRERTNLIHTINCGFEFAMVAAGKLEGRIALDPYGQDWDFAPGSLLVAEAGGIVTNIGQDSYDYKNHDYLAVNPVIYEQLTKGNDALFPKE